MSEDQLVRNPEDLEAEFDEWLRLRRKAGKPSIPPEIQQSCSILGIRFENLDSRVVITAWKTLATPLAQLAQSGQDKETISNEICKVNIAKDILTRWCDNPPSRVPPKIRESCLRLLLHPEKLTVDAVTQAWSRKITRKKFATELINARDNVRLNIAKDNLIRWIQWLEANPGADTDPYEPDEFSKVPRRPLPGSGNSSIELALPESEETKESE